MEQKIILLDDDMDDLQPLMDYLRIFDVQNFVGTTDIDEAIAWAIEDSKGKSLCGVTFITDYNMGIKNGFDVMKAVVEVNPIVRFIFMSNQPTVPILLEITTLGIGFYFLDKNKPDFYERIMRKIGKAQAILGRVMQEIIDRENARVEEEKRQIEILEAASNTLKILKSNG